MNHLHRLITIVNTTQEWLLGVHRLQVQMLGGSKAGSKGVRGDKGVGGNRERATKRMGPQGTGRGIKRKYLLVTAPAGPTDRHLLEEMPHQIGHMVLTGSTY